MIRRSILLGTGSALPKRVVTNAELTETVDTSDEWIVERTGIRMRHIERGVQGALFRTRRAATPAGRFSGPEVVSMRPFATADVPRIRAITGARPPKASSTNSE